MSRAPCQVAATRRAHPDRASFTLEIHESRDGCPLDGAAELFRHWQDLTNAERMNRWLAQNAMLIATS